MSVAALAVYALACARLTRLVTTDDFPLVARPRAWVRGRDRSGTGPAHWAAELVSCAWCAGVWCATALACAADRWGSVPAPVLTVMAGAWVAGAAAGWADH